MVLGIYGAGGLGREVYILAKKINQNRSRWTEIVFIDDANNITEMQGKRVLTLSAIVQEYSELEVVIAVGEPSVREILYKRVKEHDISLATVIHPQIYIDETTKIGDGVVICEGVTITCDVTIGDNSYIQPHAVIGHDISIGMHTVISANCHIGGTNKIGNRVYMGFLSGTKEHLTIGNDVICSAGAIVFRDMPDEVIAVGNPARIMKKNEEKKVF